MVNVAILGVGDIAAKMASTLSTMITQGDQSLCMYSVASRDGERARRFAEQYGFQKAYGSYEDMLSDPDVHLVYVATPHSHHYEHMKRCIAHSKHVLCEKAFTVNARQAEEVTAMARAKGLLMAEAIWTRYQPARQMILDILGSGFIGEPKMLTANLCYPIVHKQRIREPELAGGALLDLGVYAINFASMVFGDKVASMQSTVQMMDTGVDMQESITLTYETGEMAILNASVTCAGDRRGMVFCTNGTLEVDNINNPATITVVPRAEGQETRMYTVPPQITGYEYEMQAAVEAVTQGWVECPAMPHSEIVRVMQVMDQLRAQWGLVYPCE